MSDARDIAARLTEVTGDDIELKPLELADLATSYAELCRSANERLRRCRDYLRRGLRSEAIHAAEIEPDLLDLVAVLHVDGIEAWDEICDREGFGRPPRLLLETAGELNEAYAAERPLDELRKRFRLLNLSRAPLRERLAILRAIAAREPDVPVWEKDVAAFETARLAEVAREVPAASAREDSDALETLVRELSADGWRVRVPDDLVGEASSELARVAAVRGERELRAILPALEAAHLAMSSEEAAALRRGWQEVEGTYGVTPPSDLAAIVDPIFAWLDGLERIQAKEREFKEACESLELAMIEAAGGSRAMLHAHHRLASLDRPIPDDLELRFQRELAGRQLAEQRRSRLVATVIGVTVLAAAIGVFALVRRGVEGSRAEGWRVQIAAAIAAGQLDDARRTFEALEKQDPEFLGRPAIAALKPQLDRAVAAEVERRAQFRKLMDRARAAGTETPDRPALASAKEIARGPDETREARELEDDVMRAEAGRRDEAQSAFGERVRAVTREIGALTVDALGADPVAFGRVLTSAKLRVAELYRSDADGVPRDFIDGRLKPLEKMLVKLDEALQQEMKRVEETDREREDVDGLLHDAVSAERLARALEGFGARHPNSLRANAFRQAASQLDAWLAVEDWCRLIAQWDMALAPRRPIDVKTRVDGVKSYLATHASSALTAPLAAYAAYLTRAQQALTAGNDRRKELRSSLDNAPLYRLRCFTARSKSGERHRFYIVKDSDLVRGDARASAIVVLKEDLTRTQQMEFDPRDIGRPEPCPEAALGFDVRATLDRWKPEEWETFWLDVAETIRAHKADAPPPADLHPALRAPLLATALTYAKQMGFGVDDECAALLEPLSSRGLDTVMWMDPDDGAAATMGKTMREAIKRMRPIAELKALAKRRRGDVLSAVSLRLAGGAVALSKGGRIEVLAESALLKDGRRALAIVREPGAAGGSLRQIGVVKSGRVELTGIPAELADGSMVFLCEAAE